MHKCYSNKLVNDTPDEKWAWGNIQTKARFISVIMHIADRSVAVDEHLTDGAQQFR